MICRMLMVVGLIAGCTAERTGPPVPSFAGAGPVPFAGGGSGAAGTPAAAAPLTAVPGCAAADSTMPGPALHAAAAAFLAGMGTCGFASCHGQEGKRAMLTLSGATDLKTLLVGHASCESLLPLVQAGGGDMALQGSWLWIKLVGAVDGEGSLVPQGTWGTGGKACGQRGTAPFGKRMPESDVRKVAELAADSRLAAVRNWICAGAPGP